jgi:hypothetical protein
MDIEEKETELLLKEYEFIQNRFEKNNKLVYRTVYLSIIYGGVIIQPLPSFLLKAKIFHLIVLTIPSALIFFAFYGMIVHFRDRRSYLEDQLRDVENRMMTDYEPVNLAGEPEKKRVNAKILQRLYLFAGCCFLLIPVVSVMWFDKMPQI